jgi:hypothetical protein
MAAKPLDAKKTDKAITKNILMILLMIKFILCLQCNDFAHVTSREVTFPGQQNTVHLKPHNSKRLQGVAGAGRRARRRLFLPREPGNKADAVLYKRYQVPRKKLIPHLRRIQLVSHR